MSEVILVDDLKKAVKDTDMYVLDIHEIDEIIEDLKVEGEVHE